MDRQLAWSAITPDGKLDGNIAIQLHLYYDDLKQEFFNYFNNMPFKFDLYISCREEIDTENLKNFFSGLTNVNEIIVRTTQNRGRDIAPLYVLFKKELLAHKYFLHIHSKKSLFTGGERVSWRQRNMNALIGSAATVKKIFRIFNDLNAGLIFPDALEFKSPIINDWLANKAQGISLLRKFNIEYDEGSYFSYPAGSFFWAKTEAVRPIFDLNLTYEDFPEERGQTDGTLAHALERVISFVSIKKGFDNYILDIDGNTVRKNRSDRCFCQVYSATKESVLTLLNQYDTVSFDIFDTLITRKLLMPDDIFLWIGELSGIDSYLFIRKKAEELARKKNNTDVKIADIYMEFPNLLGISVNESLKLMQLEIACEKEICVARRDMIDIVTQLKNGGKHIVLVSDMYLTSEIITDILENCGYDKNLWDDIYISCECGLRKDRGDIWNFIDEKYHIFKPHSFIHVGDNLRSDIQILNDRHGSTYYIPSSLTLFKEAGVYNGLKSLCEHRTVSDSMMLGLVVNNMLFNSPFSLNQGRRINPDPYSVGYAFVGPVLSAFAAYLIKNSSKDKLLFLAREGKILQDIYRTFCLNLKKEMNDNEYLLCSRRAVGMASIRDTKDIIELILSGSKEYHGTIDALFKVRTGINIAENVHIDLPDDEQYVRSVCVKYSDLIIRRAEEERNNFYDYLEGVYDDCKVNTVVDLGYSGSMQYYLANTLQKQIKGLYLACVEKPKPLTIGCSCDSLYKFNHSWGETTFLKYSLMLESMLKIEEGQFMCFEKRNSKLCPRYGDIDYISNDEKDLQKGYLTFVNDYSLLLRQLNFEVNKDISEQLFCALASNGSYVDADVLGKFFVEDNYANSVRYLQYNLRNHVWDRVNSVSIYSVSVIIPFYNNESTLEKAVNSVLNNSLQDVEILLINDGSTDNSLAIAKKLESATNNIKVFTSEHHNAGYCRNVGIRNSHGMYLYFLDADDFLCENALQKASDILNKTQSDFTIFGHYKYNALTGETDEQNLIHSTGFITSYSRTPLELLTAMPAAWDKMFRASFIKDNNIFFDELECANDRFFYMQACFKANSVVYLNEKLIKYTYLRTDSLANSKRLVDFDSPIKTYKHTKSLFEGQPFWIRKLLFRIASEDMLYFYDLVKDKVAIKQKLIDFFKDEQKDGYAFGVNEIRNYRYYYEMMHDNSSRVKVSALIVTYNQAPYVSRAIESALMQLGDFDYEIIISDDGSTDGTAEIVADYAVRYPKLIRNISKKINCGISKNYRKLFSAANGKYCAILEGDDFWTDPYKLQRQKNFLETNLDCSMVFNKISFYECGKYKAVPQQERLKKNKLDAADMAKESWNLILNFSCCMYRTNLVKSLPDILYWNRLSEIALSYYLANYGFIGFIPQRLSAYRNNPKGVWNGSTEWQKKVQSQQVLATTLGVTSNEYYGNVVVSYLNTGRLDNHLGNLNCMKMNQPVVPHNSNPVYPIKANTASNMGNIISNYNSKQQSNDSLNTSESDLEAIKNSFSFKIGRVITWIPRCIRNMIRKVIRKK